MATFTVDAIIGRNVICRQTAQDALTGLPVAGPGQDLDLTIKFCNLYDWLQPGGTITVTWPSHAGPTNDPGGVGL